MDIGFQARSEDRAILHNAIAAIGLPICLRRVEEFRPPDESVLYARTKQQEVFVFIRRGASWKGVRHYVDDAKEDRLVRRLTVEVANKLDGHVGAIVDLVKEWFE